MSKIVKMFRRLAVQWCDHAPMRSTLTKIAETLATTEADFCQTHLERHEETQRNLNELYAQMCQNRS